jgi:hypothetical protein
LVVVGSIRHRSSPSTPSDVGGNASGNGITGSTRNCCLKAIAATPMATARGVGNTPCKARQFRVDDDSDTLSNRGFQMESD